MLFSSSSWGDCQTKSLSTSFRNFPRWLSFTKLSKLKKCLHSNIFGLNALLKCKIFVLKCRSQSFQISLQNSSHQNSIFSHFNSPQYFSGSSNIFLRLFLTIWTFSRCVEHVDDGREPPKVQLPHPRQGDQGQGELLGWWWWWWWNTRMLAKYHQNPDGQVTLENYYNNLISQHRERRDRLKRLEESLNENGLSETVCVFVFAYLYLCICTWRGFRGA